MKSVVKFIIFLAGLMFILLTGGIIYFCFFVVPFYNAETRVLYYFIMFLLVFFAIASGVVTTYASIYLYRKGAKRPDIERAVIISESNIMLREYSLLGKDSALIGKSEYAYIDLKDEGESQLIGYEHAVINRIGQNWFVENISEEYILALKRSDGQYVYKLKTGVCYKLYVNDVLYISNIRLLFL